MNLRAGKTREEPEINFIPLIDVLLVILIFLMVTTTYQRVAELQITLPEADSDQAKQRPKEINVGGDAREPVVIINADANATHQSVVHVMEAARLAGLVHITFATQSPSK